MTLFGNRVSEDEISRVHPGAGWASIQYNRCPSKKGKCGHTHTKRTPCGKGGGEGGCFYKPRNTKDGQQTTRRGVRGLGQSPQQSSDETNSVDMWTSDFWPPDPGDSKCLLLFSLGYFIMPALGNKCITLLRNRVSCSYFILLKTFLIK